VSRLALLLRARVRRDPMIAAAAPVAREHGCRLLLVGGVVRDLALGAAPRDADFLLLGRRRRAAVAAIAAALGARAVRFRKRGVENWRVAVAGREHDLVTVAPGRDEGRALAAELRRRDFTMNAIAFDVHAQRILDPCGGQADLRRRRVRATGAGVFRDDPLRLLRAVRFVCERPSLAIAPGTRDAIAKEARRIRRVSAERIRDELDRILASRRSAWGIREADRLGLLAPVIPEIVPMRGLEQNRWHHLDGWGHTLAALDAAADPAHLGRPVPGAEVPKGERLVLLRWTLLLHDLGKVPTRTVDEDGEAHFFGHEEAGAVIAARIAKRLRFSTARARAVRRLIELHLRVSIPVADEVSDRAWRRLIRDGGELTPLLVLHSLADKAASRGRAHRATTKRLRAACNRLMTLYREEAERILAPPRLVDGSDVMRLRGIPPGPEVGRWIEEIRSRQIAGEIRTRDEALEILRLPTL